MVAGEAARRRDGVCAPGRPPSHSVPGQRTRRDGTQSSRRRTSGEPQPFREGIGAQLSGALEVELESVGADRRPGLQVGPWKLLIEAVRHDLAPSSEKKGSGCQRPWRVKEDFAS